MLYTKRMSLVFCGLMTVGCGKKAAPDQPLSPQVTEPSNELTFEYRTSATQVLAGLKADDVCRVRFVEESANGVTEGLHVFAGNRVTYRDGLSSTSSVIAFLKEAEAASLCRKVAEPCRVLFRNPKEVGIKRGGYQVKIADNDISDSGFAYPTGAAGVIQPLIDAGICTAPVAQPCKIIFRNKGEIDTYGGYFVEQNGKPLHEDGMAYLSGGNVMLKTLQDTYFCAK
jgi:hypothetical protein